jgi:hypothetical protein
VIISAPRVHWLAEIAARVTALVQILLQWDDDRVPRAQGPGAVRCSGVG